MKENFNIPDFSLEAAVLDEAARLPLPAPFVVGVDEAGRGPWAGPVTAGAAWVNPEAVGLLPKGINDSKKLKPSRRAELWERLQRLAEDPECLKLGVASVGPEEIDDIGILPATFRAMEEAVLYLRLETVSGGSVYDRDRDFVKPLHLLVDGNLTPDMPRLTGAVQTRIDTIVKGDGRSLSIAVAALAAKQTRDGIMAALDAEHPGYGWASNMGYGAEAHRKALAELGPTPQHRLSYKPVAEAAEAHGYTRYASSDAAEP